MKDGAKFVKLFKTEQVVVHIFSHFYLVLNLFFFFAMKKMKIN